MMTVPPGAITTLNREVAFSAPFFPMVYPKSCPKILQGRPPVSGRIVPLRATSSTIDHRPQRPQRAQRPQRPQRAHARRRRLSTSSRRQFCTARGRSGPFGPAKVLLPSAGNTTNKLRVTPRPDHAIASVRQLMATPCAPSELNSERSRTAPCPETAPPSRRPPPVKSRCRRPQNRWDQPLKFGRLKTQTGRVRDESLIT